MNFIDNRKILAKYNEYLIKKYDKFLSNNDGSLKHRKDIQLLMNRIQLTTLLVDNKDKKIENRYESIASNLSWQELLVQSYVDIVILTKDVKSLDEYVRVAKLEILNELNK